MELAIDNESTGQDFWHLKESAILFGQSLRRWRRRNTWAQDTSAAWGREAGIPYIHASQWSNLENGRMRSPWASLFLALGDQNRRLSDGDYGAIRHRDLMERLKAASPVAEPEGKPWRATDFWACFSGLQPWPHPEEQPPEMSDQDGSEWSQSLRASFRETVEQIGADPLGAMVELLEYAPQNQQDREKFQRVMLGFEDYSGGELLALWRLYMDGEPWGLDSWRESHGLVGGAPRDPWAKPRPR